jgi:uncharacterized protein (DUF1810 family)
MTDSFELHRFVNAQAPLRGHVKKGRQAAVIPTNFLIAVRVTAATKLALECSAAVAGMSGAGFVESMLARALADGGYIENGETSRVRGFHVYDSSAIGAVC